MKNYCPLLDVFVEFEFPKLDIIRICIKQIIVDYNTVDKVTMRKFVGRDWPILRTIIFSRFSITEITL